MNINVIKVIDTAQPQPKEYSRKEVNNQWRQANLYEIENKEVLQIVNKGKHVRYLVKR